MATVTELKKERSALVARLRELDLKLAACGVPLGKSDAYAPSHTYDREAVERLIAKWDKDRESVPYDPAEWEELERNIGIYEYLHPEAGE